MKYHFHAGVSALAVALAVIVMAPSAAIRADDTSVSSELSSSELKAVEKLQTADSNKTLSALRESYAGSSETLTRTLINQFSQSKESLLARYDQLSPAERHQAAKDCAKQEAALETLMSSLSEDLQTNVIEALARCQLLQR